MQKAGADAAAAAVGDQEDGGTGKAGLSRCGAPPFPLVCCKSTVLCAIEPVPVAVFGGANRQHAMAYRSLADSATRT